MNEQIQKKNVTEYVKKKKTILFKEARCSKCIKKQQKQKYM